MDFKRIFIFALLGISYGAIAQTGIGTTAPVNKFEVFAQKADPATSGAAANGNIRVGAYPGTHVLDLGMSSTATYSWLQSRDRLAYGTYNFLALNPLGGYVGIGTSAPLSTLTVGNAGGTVSGEITLNPTTTQYEGGQINFKKSLTGSTVDWIIDQYGSTASDARLRIFNTIELNGIVIKENGFIGMGNATPTVRLQVTGDIIANSIAGSSDIRFKKDIAPIENPLAKVMQLRGVNFNWNTSAYPQRMFSEKRTMGFIAQEVEKVVPEIVQSENTIEGYKSVQYDKVVALLVEAVKAQQKQIQQLKREVKKLKKQAR